MTSDNLDDLREQIDRIDDVPVSERPALFAAINDAVRAELDAMDEQAGPSAG